MVMGLWGFIGYNECSSLVGMLLTGGAVCVGGRERWEISVLCSPFCCESKSALENEHDFLPQGWKGVMGQRLCWQAEEWLRQAWGWLRGPLPRCLVGDSEALRKVCSSEMRYRN